MDAVLTDLPVNPNPRPEAAPWAFKDARDLKSWEDIRNEVIRFLKSFSLEDFLKSFEQENRDNELQFQQLLRYWKNIAALLNPKRNPARIDMHPLADDLWRIKNLYNSLFSIGWSLPPDETNHPDITRFTNNLVFLVANIDEARKRLRKQARIAAYHIDRTAHTVSLKIIDAMPEINPDAGDDEKSLLKLHARSLAVSKSEISGRLNADFKDPYGRLHRRPPKEHRLEDGRAFWEIMCSRLQSDRRTLRDESEMFPGKDDRRIKEADEQYRQLLTVAGATEQELSDFAGVIPEEPAKRATRGFKWLKDVICSRRTYLEVIPHMATGYVINSGLRQMTKFGVVAMLGSAGAPALASVAVTTLAVGVVTITSRVVLNMARNGRAYKEKHGKGMSLRASFNEIYPTKTSKIIGLGAAFGGTAVGAALVEYHDYLEPLWKKCANLFESTQAPQAPIPLASAPVPPPGPATAPIPSVTPASEPPPPPVPVPAPSPESATTPIPSATPLPQAPHPPVSAPAPTPKLRALTPSAEAPSPPLAAPPAEVPPLFAHEPPPPDITPGPLPSLSDRATALLDPLKGKYPALVHQAEAFFARGGHDLQGIERMVQIVHGLSNGHGVTAASRKIAATINQTALDIAKANHLDAAHHATVKVLEANQAFFETHGIGTPRNLPDALEHAKDAGRRGRKFARYIVGTLGFKPAPA